jgi:hypothetical protein
VKAHLGAWHLPASLRRAVVVVHVPHRRPAIQGRPRLPHRHQPSRLGSVSSSASTRRGDREIPAVSLNRTECDYEQESDEDGENAAREWCAQWHSGAKTKNSLNAGWPMGSDSTRGFWEAVSPLKSTKCRILYVEVVWYRRAAPIRGNKVRRRPTLAGRACGPEALSP